MLIEIWQANAAGKYAHPADRQPGKAIDPTFRGWGRACTDFETGVYAFDTDQAGHGRGPQRPHHGAAHQRLDRRARHQHRPQHAHLLQRRGRRQRQRRGAQPDRVGAASRHAHRRAARSQARAAPPSIASTSACRARTRPSSSTSDADATPDPDRSVMRRAIATVSLSGTLRQKLEAIAAARFDGYRAVRERLHQLQRQPARELARSPPTSAWRSTCTSRSATSRACPTTLFTTQPRPRRAQVRPDAGARRAADAGLLEHVAARLVDDAERAAAQLHALAERAARRNLRIGFEALAWGRHVNLLRRRPGRSSQRADHPHLGLILDSFHTLSLERRPGGIAHDPGRAASSSCRWPTRRCSPWTCCSGRATTATSRARASSTSRASSSRCCASGYPARCRSRSSTTSFARRRTGAPRSTRCARCSTSRARCAAGSSARRAAARRRAAPARARRIALFDPPAPPRSAASPSSSSRVDEASAQALGALLRELGFRARRQPSLEGGRRCTGRATSTSIVNAEPDSDARERFDEHGPCGLRHRPRAPTTRRARSTRATALLSARFDSPLGAGELRAAGDASRRAARSSTSCRRRSARRPARGRLRPRRRGEPRRCRRRPAAASTTSRSASRPTSSTPGSCSAARARPRAPARASSWPTRSAWSAAAASPTPTAACASSSTSRRASARAPRARSRRRGGGGGPSHRASPAPTSSPPSHALRARRRALRADLAPTTTTTCVARLDIDAGAGRAAARARHPLRPRRRGGEYLHVYSESFADRFFFEIVQRTGYDGYGALNAPARMAAQEQADAERASPARR